MYNFVMYETNCATKIICVKYIHGEHKIKVEFKHSSQIDDKQNLYIYDKIYYILPTRRS